MATLVRPVTRPVVRSAQPNDASAITDADDTPETEVLWSDSVVMLWSDGSSVWWST